MAKDPDDCEHWLLPQFLIQDDDLLTDFSSSTKKNGVRNGANNDGMGFNFKQDFGCGFGDFGSFGLQSDLGSPIEGSTETESDDDDYVSELTRKFAYSTLDESTYYAFENKKGWGLSGSPESTPSGALTAVCGCNRCSTHCTATCLSQVASPTGMNGNETAWELLHAAAGEIARLRMIQGFAGFERNCKNGGLVGPPRKPSPISIPQRSQGQNPSNLSYQQHLKALHLLRQQQMSQKKYQLSQTQQVALNGGGRKQNGSMGAWPTLEQSQRQQETGSGMRAVFLGNPGSKRECAGTGVFLPRRVGAGAGAAAAAPRKKPGCSTVLLPDRVVQALNLNLEVMDAPAQPKYSGALGPDYDYEAAAMRYRNWGMDPQRQSGSLRQQHAVGMKQAQELQLPQEWTY